MDDVLEAVKRLYANLPVVAKDIVVKRSEMTVFRRFLTQAPDWFPDELLGLPLETRLPNTFFQIPIFEDIALFVAGDIEWLVPEGLIAVLRMSDGSHKYVKSD